MRTSGKVDTILADLIIIIVYSSPLFLIPYILFQIFQAIGYIIVSYLQIEETSFVAIFRVFYGILGSVVFVYAVSFFVIFVYIFSFCIRNAR